LWLQGLDLALWSFRQQLVFDWTGAHFDNWKDLLGCMMNEHRSIMIMNSRVKIDVLCTIMANRISQTITARMKMKGIWIARGMDRSSNDGVQRLHNFDIII